MIPFAGFFRVRPLVLMLRRGGPLADRINREDRGVAPSREVVGGGGVREMVRNTLYAAVPAGQLAQLAPGHGAGIELFEEVRFPACCEVSAIE